MFRYKLYLKIFVKLKVKYSFYYRNIILKFYLEIKSKVLDKNNLPFGKILRGNVFIFIVNYVKNNFYFTKAIYLRINAVPKYFII